MACSRLGSGKTDYGRQDAEIKVGPASRNTYLGVVEFFEVRKAFRRGGDLNDVSRTRIACIT
jgi:hypothetical protein